MVSVQVDDLVGACPSCHGFKTQAVMMVVEGRRPAAERTVLYALD